MERVEKRKHARVETSNHILYESMDNEGQIVSRSMGKAINISRSGIMLETPYPIEANNVTLVTVDIENDLIEMTCRLIYCRETDSGVYQAGFSFIGSDEDTAKFAVKLIKLYHHRKHNLIMQIAA
ncbi:MAG: PilZ domain-containing protein [Desulfobacterales bacterium]|nr:MAG: PilZ domain-containing protein [Desulfobacterales bacterium]